MRVSEAKDCCLWQQFGFILFHDAAFYGDASCLDLEQTEISQLLYSAVLSKLTKSEIGENYVYFDCMEI
jgi:hypothetical protein